MNDTKQLLDQITSKNFVEAQKSFDSILMQKIGERLDLKKSEIAPKIFDKKED